MNSADIFAVYKVEYSMKGKIIRIISYFLVAASIGFIIYSLRSVDTGAVISRFSLSWIPYSIVLIAVYFFMNLIRAYNWTFIIDYVTGIGSFNKKLISIYLRTEIAKYIPSNMVHFAGRHIMARNLGFTDAALITANIFDMVLFLFTAGVIILIGIAVSIIQIPEYIISRVDPVKAGIGGVVIFCIFAVILFKTKKEKIQSLMKYIKPEFILKLTIIILLFLPSFIISAGMLVVILKFQLSANISFNQIPYLFTAFTLAWTAGFVIPGAPGGFGVRETALVLLFAPICGEGNAVLSGLILRIYSIAGDLLAFTAAGWISREKI